MNVEGDFKNKEGEEARKLALYTQDADRKVTERYTLTVKNLKLILHSSIFQMVQ
ncbi:hypothetical protein AAFF39_08365 [Lactococcus garvieae]